MEKFDALGGGGRGIAHDEDSDLHREGKGGVMRSSVNQLRTCVPQELYSFYRSVENSLYTHSC